jgi:hypothetical protein
MGLRWICLDNGVPVHAWEAMRNPGSSQGIPDEKQMHYAIIYIIYNE